MARLLMFGPVRDAAGCRETTVDATSVGEALDAATDRFGTAFAKVLSICSLIVDEQSVTRARMWDVPVGADTEIAVLPPVSGGSGRTDAGRAL